MFFFREFAALLFRGKDSRRFWPGWTRPRFGKEGIRFWPVDDPEVRLRDGGVAYWDCVETNLFTFITPLKGWRRRSKRSDNLCKFPAIGVALNQEGFRRPGRSVVAAEFGYFRIMSGDLSKLGTW